MARLYALRHRAREYAIRKASVAIAITGFVVIGAPIIALGGLSSLGRKA